MAPLAAFDRLPKRRFWNYPSLAGSNDHKRTMPLCGGGKIHAEHVPRLRAVAFAIGTGR